jgi:hypothetical protein
MKTELSIGLGFALLFIYFFIGESTNNYLALAASAVTVSALVAQYLMAKVDPTTFRKGWLRVVAISGPLLLLSIGAAAAREPLDQILWALGASILSTIASFAGIALANRASRQQSAV